MRILAVVTCAILLGGCADVRLGPDAEDVTQGQSEIATIPFIPSPTLATPVTPEEWRDALVTAGSFEIMDSSVAAGSFPFTARLGVNETFLFLAVVVENLTPNPYNVPGGKVQPNTLEIYVTRPSGPLTRPSDGFAVADGLQYGSSMTGHYWSGSSWVVQSTRAPSDFNEGYPTGGYWGRSHFENNTISYEIYLDRRGGLPEYDGFELAPEQMFRMALRLVRQTPSGTDVYDRHADVFPGEGWTPRSHLDPSEWLMFRAP